MSECIIETRGLHKTYENGVKGLQALKGIDLKIKRGELFCIQGQSGAGKTTLLNLIGTLDRPTKGEVLFEGKDIFAFNEKELAEFRNKRLGFVFQFYHLLAEFTALENVLLPSLIKDFLSRRQAEQQAKIIFEDVGLSQRLHFMPRQLSGGEQQRVAIARSLMNKPDILLCDEPTGNLDSENGQKILNILKNLSRKNQTTIVLVTHNSEIAESCDTVISLKDGRLETRISRSLN
jgi:lipoprotein-releasing system ATP-binding protein